MTELLATLQDLLFNWLVTTHITIAASGQRVRCRECLKERLEPM